MAKKTKTRDASGRFKKSTSRGRSSTAIARASVSAPARRAPSKRRAPVKVKRRRSGGGGGSVIGQLKQMAPELLASSLYAFITRSSSPTAQKINSYIKKLPTLDAIGKPASHGILALFIASNISGRPRRVLALGAKAALHQAAANLGASGFDHQAAATLAGEEVYLEGDMDDDIEEYYDDEAEIVDDEAEIVEE